VIDTQHLLADEQMRGFIVNGFVKVQTDLPADLHQRIFDKTDAIFGRSTTSERRYNPLNNILPMVHELQDVLESPQVQGALASILGNGFVLHPHRHCHPNFPLPPLEGGHGLTMHLHKDGHATGKRPRHRLPRWAILFYFPQECPIELGPTCLIPGNQYLRRVTPEGVDTRHMIPEQQNDGTFLLPDTFTNRVLATLQSGLGVVWIMHFDIAHSVFFNHQDLARYGMKFVYMRTEEPTQPSWYNTDDQWQLPETNLVSDDHEIMWTYIWNWLSGKSDLFQSNRSNAEIEVKYWINQLSADDSAQRLQAANELGFRRQEANVAIPALVDCLRDDYEPVCLNATYALSAIGAEAVDPLIKRLEDGKAAYREEPILHISHAAHGLAAVGEAAVPALSQAMAHPEEHIRAQAAYALGEMGWRAAIGVSTLQRVLTDEAEPVRQHVVSALGIIKQPLSEIVPTLIQILENEEDPALALFSAQALVRIGADAEAAIPALTTALKSSSPYTRAFSAEALSRIGTTEALKALVSFLRTYRWFNYQGGKIKVLEIPIEEPDFNLSDAETTKSIVATAFENQYKRPLTEVVHILQDKDDRLRFLLADGNETFAELDNGHLQYYYLRRVSEGGYRV